MKNKVIGIGLIMGLAWPVLTQSAFVQPPLDRRYDQVCWLATHNAYSAERYGYIYANQYYTLEEQFQRGVRAFELDTYKRCWDKTLGIFGGSGCTVSMCHGDCNGGNKYIYNTLKPGNDALGLKTSALEPFRKFLEADSQAIISLTLENYVTETGLLDKHIEESGISKYVLRPEDWDPTKQGWPTLQWMVSNNKRVVIFNSLEPRKQGYSGNLPYAATKYTYYQWPVMVQNQWAGAGDISIALRERDSSKSYDASKRFLLEFDWFFDGGKMVGGGLSDLISKAADLFGKETPFGGNYSQVNGPNLRSAIEQLVQKGLTSGLAKGRYPNFIKVDYFHEGNPIALVNEINAKANDANLRNTMFAPLEVPNYQQAPTFNNVSSQQAKELAKYYQKK